MPSEAEPHARLRLTSELEHSGRSSTRCQEDDSEDDDSDNPEAAHSDAENDDQSNSTVRPSLVDLGRATTIDYRRLESEYIVPRGAVHLHRRQPESARQEK